MKLIGFATLSASVCTAAMLLLTPGTSSAQTNSNNNQNQNRQRGGGGNFDPAQFRQRMIDRMRDSFDVKGDDEWKIISERIDKVLQARMDTGGGFGRAFRGGGQQGGDTNNNNNNGGRNRGGFGNQTPDPDAEALQKAIADKAPADEIKAKLAKYRASRKDKEAKLEQAQEDLKKVLSLSQEGTAVLFGLIN